MTAPLEEWLAQLCRQVSGSRTGIVVLWESPEAPAKTAAVWPVDRPIEAVLLEVAELVWETARPVMRGGIGDGGCSAVAVPLPVADDAAQGAVVIALEGRGQAELLAALRVLQSGQAWLPTGPSPPLATPGAEAPAPAAREALELVATVLDHEHFRAAAVAVVTELATRHGFERVSLGLLEGRQMRLCAVSHSARFDERTGPMRQLLAAMEEAVDQESALLEPPSDPSDAYLRRAHEELRSQGSGAVGTLPISQQGRIIGAVSIETQAGCEFEELEFQQLGPLVELVGPLLASKLRDERPLRRIVWDAWRGRAVAFADPERPGRRLGAAVVALLALLLALTPGTHRISAPAELEGTVQRVVVAALDGYVAESRARAGDVVKQGQVLAALDGSELELERRKWIGQREQYAREQRAALAVNELARMSVLRAQIDQTEAEIALIDELLERTRLVAPFDGIVAKGDLSQKLGSPVVRGDVLFEIAPLDQYRIILEVDDRNISYVSSGQRGELTLSALPNRALPLVIERVTPVATSDDARTFFRVEAALEASLATLRPGMEGVGKIDAGRRSLLWIWTHSLVDWLRLWAWSFS